MNFLDKLLEYYNVSISEYNHLKSDAGLADIPNASIFNNINEVKAKINDAINAHNKILIYGDYDADGILATSILVNTFKKLKYPVEYYIPSRYLDGYGINEEKVIKAKEKGYQLIITVDNGINAVDAIKKAKEIGIEMIITDHHDYQEEITNFLYLHPKKSKLKYATSGAMIAFYLSLVLLNEIDPYLLTLGATSILSDSMPLKGENRNIVKLGLKYLNKYKFDKFNLLSEEFIYTESTLTLKVIPKINAVGRIEKDKEANILVKYFTSDNYHELVQIKQYLNNINEKRKVITLGVINNLKVEEEKVIVMKLDILSGLTGLIANRLLSIYNRPVCIFSNEIIDGNIRGSIRSKHSFNVMDFIKFNKNLFVESGGHELAAGIVIKESDFDKFKLAFLSFFNSHPFVNETDSILISEEEINMTNFELIRTFSPFGQDWKEPLFLLKDIDSKRIRRIGKNHEHLSIYLNDNNRIIGFNYPFKEINPPTINFLGHFRLDKYNNKKTLNFLLND